MPTPDLLRLLLLLLLGLLGVLAGLLPSAFDKQNSLRGKCFIFVLGAACGVLLLIGGSLISTAQAEQNADWIKNVSWTLGFGYAFSLPTTVYLLITREKAETSSPRKQLLEAVRDEVAQRLEVSLHNQKMIDLATKELPHHVGESSISTVNPDKRQPINWIEQPVRWMSQFLGKADNRQDVHPADEKIIDVFKRKEGKLLILGEPGAGKTTTLLDLAKDLCAEATENENQPIPILFDLFSWKDNSQSLTEWLAAELKTKYGVRADIAKALLDEHQLLPFLDGLDEQEETRRVSCLRQINEFLETDARARHLVVCSRLTEFENCRIPLRLNGAVCLQPLEPTQMQKYFREVGCFNLWDGINNVPDLLELAKSPLLLTIMALASDSISISDWQKCNTSDERQRYLFDKYIEQMFKREIKLEFEPHYSQGQQPNEANSRQWLVWLAKQLKDKNQTDFLIERMQPSWLKNTNYRWMYRIIVGLFFGLFFGLFYMLFLDLFFGLIVGLIHGIFFGLSDRIEPLETLKWSWKKAQKGLIIGLIFGLIFGLIIGLIFGLIFGLIIGLISEIIFGLLYGLSGLEIEIKGKIKPNQGIWESANKAVLFTLMLGLLLAFSFYPALQIKGRTFELIDAIIFGLVNGLIFGIVFGGGACIQHFILRLVLWVRGDIPWNYAKFLNYASERLFLQRIGGRYRFIHDLLREHFAQMSQ